ncbi:MFS transporter [Roseateles violae]|uniref:MFS transporter n=1 Tax=Roseateles violae TaxID=3058042 RepID=A0ABT8E071_9BURK|nr:MFS transporter [Pelomonas sp. PFR6]MDN3923199.1 MFS transporter [Pelomonas sp. PFR6]
MSVATPTAPFDASPPAALESTPKAAWYALFVLTMVTLFAFVDRTIFVLLAEPIKTRLSISDFQLGLLQGTGIALFASLASYPLGWLSDRFDRRVVLGGCVIVWSLAVVACALSQTFEQLFIASAMVGAGEAGLVPVVFSMIPDLFPVKRRQLANSIFAIAAASAGGLALAISGQLVAHVDAVRPLLPAALQAWDGWRLSLLGAALPAPLMLLLIATVRLRKRTADSTPAAAVAAAQPDEHASVRLLPFIRENFRTVVFFQLGIATATLGFGSMGAWVSVILMRVYHRTAEQIGSIVGPLTLLSTGLAFLLSIYVARRFGERHGEALPVRALWLSYLVAALANLSLLFIDTVEPLYVISTLTGMLTGAAGMMYPTAIQNMAPAQLRGRLISIQSVCSLIFGAIAAPVVGLVSDGLGDSPRSILIAAISVSVPALLLSATLLRASESTFARTVAAARRIEEAAAH